MPPFSGLSFESFSNEFRRPQVSFWSAGHRSLLKEVRMADGIESSRRP